MMFKSAINKAQIVPINQKHIGNIKLASGWADINSFPERFKKLFANFITANSISVGEYNPEFKYYRVIAMHGDIPNDNGDLFLWGNPEDKDVPELLRFEKNSNKYVYESFIGRGNYKNHDNNDVNKAVGIILDVAPNKEGKFIEALLAVDTKKDPELIRGIENGYIDSVSMGALVQYSICSICNNIAYNEHQYCDHIKSSKGKTMYHQGEYKKVYEDNRGVNFIELSWVTVPADPNAKLLEKVAENQKIFQYAIDNLDDKQLMKFIGYSFGFLENKLDDKDINHLSSIMNFIKND